MLGFLFSPILVLEPIIAVTIFASIILLFINLCYRFLINQKEAKEIKERMKEINQQAREEQKQGNTEKFNELTKQALAENSKLMGKTMRPMMVSLVIILLFLPWMQSVYGDIPANLEEGKGNVTLDSEVYDVEYDGNEVTVMKDDQTLFSSSLPVTEQVGKSKYILSHVPEGWFIIMYHPENIKFARIIAEFPEPINLPLFGKDVGFIGWYILVSIPFALIIRKILKIST